MPTLVTTVQAMTDMIPLLDKDTVVGSPTNGQFVIGRNNARDFRVGYTKAMFASGPSGPNVRVGTICTQWDGTLSTPTYVDGRVSQLGTPGSAVQIKAGRTLINKTGQGPYLLIQETDIASMTLAAADTQNRYDIVYQRPYDGGGGDSSSGPNGPYYEYVRGDPSASPSMATAIAAVPADCYTVAAIYRPANNSNITDSNITDLRKSTGVLGAVRPLLPGDALTDAGAYVGEHRLRVPASALVSAGAPHRLIDYWGADSQWHGTQPLLPPRPAQTFSGNITAGSTASMVSAGMAIPDPGWPYYLQCSGKVIFNLASGSPPQSLGGHFRIDSSTWSDLAADVISKGIQPITGGVGFAHSLILPPDRSPVQTGSHTLYMIIKNVWNTTLNVNASDGEGHFEFNVSIIPA